MNLLEDEIALLQYGQSTEVEFFSYSLSENLPSAWINWPTPEEPTNKYKYVSIEFNMKLDKLNWQRATYSLLDWLGDLGGLLDILLHIGQVLIEPVAMFTLQASLMTNFFRFKESGSTQKVNHEEQTELDADLVE
mmetsp:Transcript_12545/g.16084  ORF Transcript_12545/g.16084 Transcript_12545/m.16084 type:complete len:135 (+) Transcript_12545:869-1273(+)|eukprot:CAMPEP_0170456786 /NCGR_PEP_ID=MMETSP0123-20130129/4295_1 /TAXON_ID=182087 /ORGANISM="Favella ehrenbergii, Strain Fehren 1" /LENGTH=134 /DNA_ID=CAMNT_0010720361 /DNA_START=783 /DNA_END=1187 /DNA_ORIENTATION=+